MRSVKRLLWFFLFGCMFFSGVSGKGVSDAKMWHVVREFPQKSFSSLVPAGNYSGITHLHDDIYAVVSDKSDSALYFNFRIQIDSITGELKRVECLGALEYVDGSRVEAKHRYQPKERGVDHEAIAKVSDSTLVVSSEGLFRLKEYHIVPKDSVQVSDTLWSIHFPAETYYSNYGYESLSYDSVHQILWAMPESVLRQDGEPATPQNGNANLLRLLGFDWSTHTHEHPLVARRIYQMDRPTTKKEAQTYVMGVSEICALPDGQLLVLEREAFIPKVKLGAFCQCKLYVVDPNHSNLSKTKLTEWKTTLTLFGHSFANYEGMCLGPQLSDGSQVLILLSDSQNQYAGVLKDWFKIIVLRAN